MRARCGGSTYGCTCSLRLWGDCAVAMCLNVGAILVVQSYQIAEGARRLG